MCSPAFLDWCRDSGIEASAVTPALIPVGPQMNDDLQEQQPRRQRRQAHNRGLIAARALRPGDALCAVPSRLLLSATTSAPRDPVLGPLLLSAQRSRPSALTHHQALCVHLLHEASKRRPASPWLPYLRELPPSFSVLAAWPRAAAEALQAPHARRACARAARSARREWEGARGVLRAAVLGGRAAASAPPHQKQQRQQPDQQQQQQQERQPRPQEAATSAPSPPSCCSWRAWLWAHGAALSRTMHLPGDRAGCLTPFGDLLNHAAPRGNAPWAPDPLEQIAGVVVAVVLVPADDADEDDEGAAAAAAAAAANAAAANAETETEEEREDGPAGDGALDAGRGAYVLRTRRALAAGDEALLSYGRHTNLELLALYGFLLPPGAPANPDDRAPLPGRHVRAAMAGGGGGGGGGGGSGGGGGGGGASSSDDEEEREGGTGVGSSSDRLASHGGGAASSSWYVQAADGRPSWALFQALRARAAARAAAAAPAWAGAAAAATTPAARPRPPPPASSSRPSSAQSLLAQALTVERWLLAACLATLRELPTTAEEDASWLAAASEARGAEAEAAPPRRTEEDEGASGDGARKKGAAASAAHDAECLRLAVEWRLQYKRALMMCVARCGRALAKGGAGAEECPTPLERTDVPKLCRGRVVALPPGGSSSSPLNPQTQKM